MSDTLPPLNSVLQLFVAVHKAINSRGVLLGYDDDYKTSFIEDHGLDESDEDEEDDKDDEDDDDLNSLKNTLCELGETVPFAIECRGKPGNSDLYLEVESDVNSDIFNAVCTLDAMDVNILLSYCEVSPFGDLATMTTKINPDVRLAMECSGERLKITKKQSSNSRHTQAGLLCGVEKMIENHLLRRSSNPRVELVLNKLNIYSKSGHFKPHTDTPTHDPALFIGTVVVCLPSEHAGGELVVRHCGKEQVFDFAQRSAVKDEIQFAAFYGDCEHEVLPVTSGHRVTLTYSILKSSNNVWETGPYKVTARSAVHEMRPELPTEIVDAMVAVSEHSGGYVGIFLSHTYTNSGLQGANLKGVDEVVFSLLKEKNIPVSLVPVISAYSAVLPGSDYDRPEVPDFSVRMLDVAGYADPRLEQHKNLPTNIPFLSGWRVDGYRIKDEKHGPEHMGNSIDDGSEERIYIKGAMIVGPL